MQSWVSAIGVGITNEDAPEDILSPHIPYLVFRQPEKDFDVTIGRIS